jgi:hypothetical protein
MKNKAKPEIATIESMAGTLWQFLYGGLKNLRLVHKACVQRYHESFPITPAETLYGAVSRIGCSGTNL